VIAIASVARALAADVAGEENIYVLMTVVDHVGVADVEVR
jgi:hypothetical protein